MKEHDFYSEEGIYTYAQYRCQELWGINYFGNITLAPRRWKRRMGAFCVQATLRSNLAFCVENTASNLELRFSKFWHETLSEQKFKSVIDHELVHWYMYVTGQPYDDTSPEFIEEIERIGGEVSRNKRSMRAYNEYKANLESEEEEASMMERQQPFVLRRGYIG